MTKLTGITRILAGLAIAAGTVGGILPQTQGAHAAVASRRDPILLVSAPTASGSSTTLIQVVATISAASSQVQCVTYAIHGPKGGAVTGELLTGANESYTYVADGSPGTYTVVTTASVSGPAVAVSVTARVLSTDMVTVLYQASTVSGLSGQAITTVVVPTVVAQAVHANANWGS